MPIGRMLNKRISIDDEVAKLSDKAIILYCWSIPHLDSEGKILASNEILKGTVVPYLKRFTNQLIGRLKNELNQSPLVIIYGENGKYMKFLGFEKNQTINKDREAPSRIPDPTPEELQSRSRQTLAKDKFKLSKDKLISKQPSAVDTALDKVYTSGLNIYSLINKTKKKLGQPKNFQFPEQVLLGVCESYLKNKEKIKDAWPWFVKAFISEYYQYNANKNITDHQKLKEDMTNFRGGDVEKLKEILQRIKGGLNVPRNKSV